MRSTDYYDAQRECHESCDACDPEGPCALDEVSEDCPYCLAVEQSRDCPDDPTTLQDLLDSLIEHHSDLTSQFYALRMSLPGNLTEDAENALATLIDCYVAKHCA